MAEYQIEKFGSSLKLIFSKGRDSNTVSISLYTFKYSYIRQHFSLGTNEPLIEHNKIH